jgi:hypothetical protein
MLITVGIFLAMFAPTGILRCRCCWWRHLLAIQKSLALFQIMSWGMMDLAPLLYIIRASEGSLLLLIWGLLAAIPTISVVLPISSVNGIGLLIVYHTPFWERGNKTSICVPRMFKSHV